MGEWEWRIEQWLDHLRRDGSVHTSVERLGADAEVWRSAMRRAARRAGLRVRTGVTSDGAVVWACHVDHVVTEAELAAAVDAVGAVLRGDVPPPYPALVVQQQRKRLRLVGEQSGRTASP